MTTWLKPMVKRMETAAVGEKLASGFLFKFAS
jgi:hypothetical protein